MSDSTKLTTTSFPWYGWESGRLIERHAPDPDAPPLVQAEVLPLPPIRGAVAQPQRSIKRKDAHVHIAPADTFLSWQQRRNDKDNFATWDLCSDGQWFNIEKKGWDNEKSFNFVNLDGRPAMGLRLESTEGETVRGGDMDKLLIQMHSRWATATGRHVFGEKRYYGFRFYLPDDFTPPIPGTQLLLWQIKQGAPFRPGVDIQLDAERRIRVAVLNDSTGSMPSSTQRVLFLSDPVPKNAWNHIVLMVIPRHARTSLKIDKDQNCKCVAEGGDLGEVKVWLNQLGAPQAHSKTHIGFDPGCFGSHHSALPTAGPKCKNATLAAESRPEGVHPNQQMEVMVGLYRTRQPHVISAFFSDIRVGGSLRAILSKEDFTLHKTLKSQSPEKKVASHHASVLLHVGLPKVASTSLQHGLFNLHPGFEAVHHFSKDQKKNALAHLLMDDLKLGKPQTVKEKAAVVSDLRELMRTNRCLVLSNEGLTSHVGRWPKKLLALHEFSLRLLAGDEFSDVTPKVLLLYRDLNDFVWSGWVQDCFHAKPEKPAPEYDAWTKKVLDESSERHSRLRFGDMTKSYAEHFGKENVLVVSLATLAQSPEHAYQQICAFAGLTVEKSLTDALSQDKRNSWRSKLKKRPDLKQRIESAKEEGLPPGLQSRLAALQESQMEQLHISGVRVV